MLLSGVTNSSKPAVSAALSNSPLTSLSRPVCFALVTAWPSRNGISGAGVPWSKSIRIDGGASRLRAGNSSTATTCSRVTSNHSIILSMGPRLRSFRTQSTQAYGYREITMRRSLAGDAFHGGALRPIQTCHVPRSFLQIIASVSANRNRLFPFRAAIPPRPHVLKLLHGAAGPFDHCAAGFILLSDAERER